MSPPTYLQRFRQIVGRALRETGQALDRLGMQTAMLAQTKHDYYDDPILYQDFLSRHRQQFPLLWSGKPQLANESTNFLAPCATLIGSVHVGPRSSIWYGAILRADECANATSSTHPSPAVSSSSSSSLPSTSTSQSKKSMNDTSTNNENDLSYTLSTPFVLDEERFRDRIDHHGGAIVIGSDTNVQDGCIITSRQNHTIIGNGVTIGHLAQIHSATIGNYCLIGMGSVILPNAVVEDGAMIAAGTVVATGQVIPSGELWVGDATTGRAKKLRDLTLPEKERLKYQSNEYVKVAEKHKPVMELGGNLGDGTRPVPFVVFDEQQEDTPALDESDKEEVPLLDSTGDTELANSADDNSHLQANQGERVKVENR